MIAELGHMALILTLALAAVSSIMGHLAANRMNSVWADRVVGLALAQFLLVGLAFAALIHAFVISDFSVRIVATNSHTLKPLLYKITGVWGNHEGSLLLWVLILTLFSALVGLFGGRLPLRLRSRVLAVQASLAIGFLLFILFTSNPFERLAPGPIEGRGLNPLLQDIGLAIHPPMLYLGYVGLSVAFSFAVAALIDREVTPAWARWVRPWTLLAWMFLTAGITLGSGWAYYELGWGGWWFWDPAENASFMPWLAATALLHSAIVAEKRDALKSWTVLLALIAFSFSLLGTFLIRSGVVTSVHAFATDPSRGLFILAFLAVVIGSSLLLYSLRMRNLTPGGLFQPVSREGALVVNNILLASYAAVVLLGTLYPLILEAASGDQISVGPPFFNFATALLMTPLVLALFVGPMLSWKRAALGPLIPAVLVVLALAAVAATVLYWSFVGDAFMTLFGLFLGAGLLGTTALELWRWSRVGKGTSRRFDAGRLLRRPLALWGMSLAHAGLGIVILAITISEAWTTERVTALRVGEALEMAGYRFELAAIEPLMGDNYSAVRAQVLVRSLGSEAIVADLAPEDRVYGQPITQTSEAGIASRLTSDLYAVIGERVDSERWSVRLYVKPFVSGLWLGAAMLVFGALLSLFDRRLRMGVPTGRKKLAAPKTPTMASAGGAM